MNRYDFQLFVPSSPGVIAYMLGTSVIVVVTGIIVTGCLAHEFHITCDCRSSDLFAIIFRCDEETAFGF